MTEMIAYGSASVRCRTSVNKNSDPTNRLHIKVLLHSWRLFQSLFLAFVASMTFKAGLHYLKPLQLVLATNYANLCTAIT